jgi:hypothetical protein
MSTKQENQITVDERLRELVRRFNQGFMTAEQYVSAVVDMLDAELKSARALQQPFTDARLKRNVWKYARALVVVD